MKKSASTVGEKRKSSSESREAGTALKEEAPSSSSSNFPEELQGFTPASEIYSVRSTTTF